MAATTSVTSGSSLSSYLHELDPKKYGGQQEDYLTRAELAIDGCVSRIQDGIKREETLTDLFFVIQKELSATRHQIAIDHSTKNASWFGRFRADRKAPVDENGYVSLVTPLGDPYQKYNAIFMEQLKKAMAPRLL